MPWGNSIQSPERALSGHTNTILSLQGAEAALVIYQSRLQLGVDTALFERDEQYLNQVQSWLEEPQQGAERLHYLSVMGSVIDISERPESWEPEEYIVAVNDATRTTLTSLIAGEVREPSQVGFAKSHIGRLLQFFREHPTTATTIETASDSWQRQRLLANIETQRAEIDEVDKDIIYLLGQRLSHAHAPLSETEYDLRIAFAYEMGLDPEIAVAVVDFIESASESRATNPTRWKRLRAKFTQSQLLGIDLDIINRYKSRLGCAVEIGRQKAVLGAAVEDGLREQQMKEMQALWGQQAGVSNELLARYRQFCFAQSKRLQQAIINQEAT